MPRLQHSGSQPRPDAPAFLRRSLRAGARSHSPLFRWPRLAGPASSAYCPVLQLVYHPELCWFLVPSRWPGLREPAPSQQSLVSRLPPLELVLECQWSLQPSRLQHSGSQPRPDVLAFRLCNSRAGARSHSPLFRWPRLAGPASSAYYPVPQLVYPPELCWLLEPSRRLGLPKQASSQPSPASKPQPLELAQAP